MSEIINRSNWEIPEERGNRRAHRPHNVISYCRCCGKAFPAKSTDTYLFHKSGVWGWEGPVWAGEFPKKCLLCEKSFAEICKICGKFTDVFTREVDADIQFCSIDHTNIAYLYNFRNSSKITDPVVYYLRYGIKRHKEYFRRNNLDWENHKHIPLYDVENRNYKFAYIDGWAVEQRDYRYVTHDEIVERWIDKTLDEANAEYDAKYNKRTKKFLKKVLL